MLDGAKIYEKNCSNKHFFYVLQHIFAVKLKEIAVLVPIYRDRLRNDGKCA